MLCEERLVCREQLLDDVAVDLLALEVPHLLVASEMRERVVRLANLVLRRNGRALREERPHSQVGVDALDLRRIERAVGVEVGELAALRLVEALGQ